MGISGTANPHRAFPVSDCAGQRFAHSPYGYPSGLPMASGRQHSRRTRSPNRRPWSATHSGVARPLQRICRPGPNGVVSMRRLVFRSDFHARFILRRIDRVAGGVNAFLIAMALGLGMLDLAYTIISSWLRSHHDDERQGFRPIPEPKRVCIADLCWIPLCAAIWRLTCVPNGWAFLNDELPQER